MPRPFLHARSVHLKRVSQNVLHEAAGIFLLAHSFLHPQLYWLRGMGFDEQPNVETVVAQH